VQQQQDPAVQKVVVGRRAPPRKWLLQHSYILKVSVSRTMSSLTIPAA
jgi:hypothetical protein